MRYVFKGSEIRAIKGFRGVRWLVLEIAYRSDEFIMITGDSGGLPKRRQSAALRTYSADIIDFISFYPGRMLVA